VSINIAIIHQDKKLTTQFLEKLEEMISSILEERELQKGELGLIFADDLYLEQLNEKYRGKSGPTDVLSFTYLEPNEREDFLADADNDEFAFGDIYISLDRAAEQAIDMKHSLESEIARLSVHGLLHLLGFEHENDQDAASMEQYEIDLLHRFYPEAPEVS
jgi:probable rRNA maturation factor